MDSVRGMAWAWCSSRDAGTGCGYPDELSPTLGELPPASSLSGLAAGCSVQETAGGTSPSRGRGALELDESAQQRPPWNEITAGAQWLSLIVVLAIAPQGCPPN